MKRKGYTELWADELLDSQKYGEYQKMIGMGVWLCSIGRFDIRYAPSQRYII